MDDVCFLNSKVENKLGGGVTLEDNFGYVILIGVLSMLFCYGLGAVVYFARKKYGVEYPAMYSDKSIKFNCLQRIHGNYLEMFPTFLGLLFCGGLTCPLTCAGGGLIYLAGRLVYSIGYATGDPKKRLFGLFSYIGLVVLLFSTLNSAVRLLRWL